MAKKKKKLAEKLKTGVDKHRNSRNDTVKHRLQHNQQRLDNYRSKYLESVKYRKKELCELFNEHWNSITDHLSQGNQTLTKLLKSYRNKIQQTLDSLHIPAYDI